MGGGGVAGEGGGEGGEVERRGRYGQNAGRARGAAPFSRQTPPRPHRCVSQRSSNLHRRPSQHRPCRSRRENPPPRVHRTAPRRYGSLGSRPAAPHPPPPFFPPASPNPPPHPDSLPPPPAPPATSRGASARPRTIRGAGCRDGQNPTRDVSPQGGRGCFGDGKLESRAAEGRGRAPYFFRPGNAQRLSAFLNVFPRGFATRAPHASIAGVPREENVLARRAFIRASRRARRPPIRITHGSERARAWARRGAARAPPLRPRRRACNGVD